MKKRLPFKQSIYCFSLFFLGLLSSNTLKAQDWTLAFCSGAVPGLTSNLYGPMYSVAAANATSRTAVIYSSAQLAGLAGATLTDMYFYKGSALAMLGTPNFKIYMKEVSNVDWGAGALTWATEIVGATLVYDGNPTTTLGNTVGWKPFTFSTNFTYSGTQNLALFFEYNNPVASSAIPFTYEYTGPCITTTNLNTTKYLYNTLGTLPPTLTSSNYRRPYIAFDTLVGVDNNIGVDSLLSPAGNFCSGLNEVGVRVANFGTNDVNSFGLHWSVNGVNQTPINNTSLLNSIYTSPSFIDITIGNIPFPYGQNTELKFWTVSPNGVIDADQSNDTLSVTINPPTEGVNVSITPNDTIVCTGSILTLDGGMQPTGAIYVWNTGGLTRTIDVDETGSYIVKVQSLGGCIDEDTVNVTFAPPPAAQSILITPTSSNSFVFNLFAEQHVDEYTWNYGDGTNEENGPGPKNHTYDEPGIYTVTCILANSCGESVVSRPVSATVTSVGDLAMLQNNIKLFPNPAKDKVSVKASDNIKLERISVYNVIGQKVDDILVTNSSNGQLNTSTYAVGTYQVLIITDKGRLMTKVQIIR